MSHRHEVRAADTALALGSGDVPVLATSRLITWMEAATMKRAAEFVAPETTTVGTAVRIAHHRATPVGGRVEVVATTPISDDGRRLTFTVEAFDDTGELIATGEIERAVVDRDRFLAKTARDDSNQGMAR